MSRFIIPLLLGFSLLFISSCSEYQKVLKSSDYELKFQSANKYFENEDYDKALPLYEELMTVYRGTQKGEKVYFNYAYTNFYMQDYVSAGYHFQNFARTYPLSQLTEEAYFMSAKCNYINSPVASLDQSNSHTAINELQIFVNTYPNSAKIPECNEMLDKLRAKIETKAFKNAKLYYNIGDYKAAIIAFQNVLKEFPDTRFREEVSFLVINAQYLLATNSVDEKKSERYQAVMESYIKFIDSYPNSQYLRGAEKYFEDSKRLKERYLPFAQSTQTN